MVHVARVDLLLVRSIVHLSRHTSSVCRNWRKAVNFTAFLQLPIKKVKKNEGAFFSYFFDRQLEDCIFLPLSTNSAQSGPGGEGGAAGRAGGGAGRGRVCPSQYWSVLTGVCTFALLD